MPVRSLRTGLSSFREFACPIELIWSADTDVCPSNGFVNGEKNAILRLIWQMAGAVYLCVASVFFLRLYNRYAVEVAQLGCFATLMLRKQRKQYESLLG